jgi:hypothetical protein
MIVRVLSEVGALLWERRFNGGETPSCFHNASYLKDGTQNQIIDALHEALDQAHGQLSCPSFEKANVIPYICLASSKV